MTPSCVVPSDRLFEYLNIRNTGHINERDFVRMLVVPELPYRKSDRLPDGTFPDPTLGHEASSPEMTRNAMYQICDALEVAKMSPTSVCTHVHTRVPARCGGQSWITCSVLLRCRPSKHSTPTRAVPFPRRNSCRSCARWEARTSPAAACYTSWPPSTATPTAASPSASSGRCWRCVGRSGSSSSSPTCGWDVPCKGPGREPLPHGVQHHSVWQRWSSDSYGAWWGRAHTQWLPAERSHPRGGGHAVNTCRYFGPDFRDNAFLSDIPGPFENLLRSFQSPQFAGDPDGAGVSGGIAAATAKVAAGMTHAQQLHTARLTGRLGDSGRASQGRPSSAQGSGRAAVARARLARSPVRGSSPSLAGSGGGAGSPGGGLAWTARLNRQPRPAARKQTIAGRSALLRHKMKTADRIADGRPEARATTTRRGFQEASLPVVHMDHIPVMPYHETM